MSKDKELVQKLFNQRVESAIRTLPNDIGDLIFQAADLLDFHPEIFLIPVLTGIGQAIGNKFVLKSKTYRNYAQLYGLNIGHKGIGKTPSDVFLRPVKLRNKHVSNESDPDERKKQSFVMEASVESLRRELINSGSVLYVADEFDGIMSNLSKSNGEEKKWRAFLNTVFSNNEVKSDFEKDQNEKRYSDEVILNLCANIHQHTYQELLTGNLYKSGFADRFIVIPLLNPRKPVTIDSSKTVSWDTYNKLFEMLYSYPIKSSVYINEQHHYFYKKLSYFRFMNISCSEDDLPKAEYCSKLEIIFHRLTLWCFVVNNAFLFRDEFESGALPSYEVDQKTIDQAFKLTDFFLFTWETARDYYGQRNEAVTNKAETIKQLYIHYGNKESFTQAGLAQLIGVSQALISKVLKQTG